MKGSVMTKEMERVETTGIAEVDEAKREFMKKFGKYAATAPLGMYLLMTPSSSKAQASGSCGCHFDFDCGGHFGHHSGSGHHYFFDRKWKWKKHIKTSHKFKFHFPHHRG